MKKRVYRDLKILTVVVLLILSFRSTFFEPYRIPSGSMIPSLLIGDFILVNKAAYGVKLPFWGDYLGTKNPVYLWGRSAPKRGDVVVFKFPKNKKINYVKRVVGLPGDTLEIRDKVVLINDKPIIASEVDGKELLERINKKFKVYNLKFFKVKTGEHKHHIQQNEDNYYQIDFDKIKIPEGKYFVLGDNRDFSSDSRFWGFVPQEMIKGRAFCIWMSLVMPASGDSFQIRWNRIFSLID